MKVFAKLARAFHDMRTGAAIEPLQTCGGSTIDQSGQRREARQVLIRCQVLDRRGRGPLIERVHEVQRRVPAAPIRSNGAVGTRLWTS